METIGKIDQQETLADNFCEDLDALETEVHDDCGLDFKTTIIWLTEEHINLAKQLSKDWEELKKLVTIIQVGIQTGEFTKEEVTQHLQFEIQMQSILKSVIAHTKKEKEE